LFACMLQSETNPVDMDRNNKLRKNRTLTSNAEIETNKQPMGIDSQPMCYNKQCMC